ncbi:hypothetical protein PAAG_08154 [Paracoccidioides lutzii Pb01]|uniref:Nuclear membrane fusion protein Kar5 n=1 Tax=Paracoccidioides lutzii (strain ATCC MYA-826 / Pb01) TaxID=502779 RepID=C1HBL3_PARBA|nr:hypothetical protein PAAG_08154 [Paracoccidioides lutzii Pb01]EEH38427.2 hypothetical protein PAAG_08154 [Paracoccidioides lutzii Pb01]
MRLQIPATCALSLIGLFLFTKANSLRSLSSRKDPNFSSLGAGYDEADLPSLLHSQITQYSEVFSSAIELLNSMKSSPSCNRMAATNLILSCQSIRGDDGNQKEALSDSLDNVKSLFAARLAVCELIGAGATIPEQCSPIFTSRKTHLHLEEENIIQLSQLEPCLKSLESRPQWWTSYSNSRQNAAVMCQAARAEIEREEELKLYKNLADLTSILTDSLNHTLISTAMEASRQRVFLDIVKEMQDNLMQDLENGFLRYRDISARVVDDLEGVQELMSQTRSDASSANKDLHSTTKTLHGLKRILDEIQLETERRASQMAAIEKKNHQESLELVSSLRQSVELLSSQHLRPILEGFGNIFYSMQAVEDLMSSMEARHDGLDARMKSLEHIFQEFEHTTLALQQIQMQQIHDQNFFQNDLRISQALLNDVAASAANLQTSIESSYAVFRKITSFSGLITSISWWILSVTVFVTLPVFHLKLGRISLLSLLCVVALYSSWVTGWLQIVRLSFTPATPPPADVIYIVSFSLGAVTGVCCFLYFATRHLLPRIRYASRTSKPDLA